ncbi:uncharacterized protein EI90DRAFT_2329644 [Cantharellus anzutake]|uniref:uncharacterized protein n=1 Tax=Cantharellus anzutake TaxID=1750568 RepID=UPI0019067339|nr:uncharacterized protein EI90DRAFT_2329644 [Cantharellus anzutake]KAF8324600.1 hypothetical protein EI90DRAFT_2329644 [Cantharellus anzutake]
MKWELTKRLRFKGNIMLATTEIPFAIAVAALWNWLSIRSDFSTSVGSKTYRNATIPIWLTTTFTPDLFVRFWIII